MEVVVVVVLFTVIVLLLKFVLLVLDNLYKSRIVYPNRISLQVRRRNKQEVKVKDEISNMPNKDGKHIRFIFCAYLKLFQCYSEIDG